MDRATLLHTESTIWLCPPSIITRQRALVDSKLYTDREMLAVTTYLNDNAQTPLGRFVAYIYIYNQLCDTTNTVTNRTDGA